MTNAFRSEEQGIVQVVVGFPAVGKRFACVENERQIQPKVSDTLFECKKWLDIVKQRSVPIFISNDIKPSDQVRELLLQCDTVLQVPLYLLRGVLADSCIDYL